MKLAIFSFPLDRYAQNGSLTVDLATGYLDRFIWASRAVDLVYEAMDDLDTTDEIEDALSEIADTNHSFASDMSMLAFQWLRDNGQNANPLLKEAQDKYY